VSRASPPRWRRWVTLSNVVTLAVATCMCVRTVHAQTADEKEFTEHVQPLLKKYCFRCHNAETAKSGIRIDSMTGVVEDRHLPRWNKIPLPSPRASWHGWQ